MIGLMASAEANSASRPHPAAPPEVVQTCPAPRSTCVRSAEVLDLIDHRPRARLHSRADRGRGDRDHAEPGRGRAGVDHLDGHEVCERARGQLARSASCRRAALETDTTATPSAPDAAQARGRSDSNRPGAGAAVSGSAAEVAQRAQNSVGVRSARSTSSSLAEADGERDDADPELVGQRLGQVAGRVGHDPDRHAIALRHVRSAGWSRSTGAVGWRSAAAALARRRRLDSRCWIHQAASASAAAMVTRMPRPDSAVERTVMAIGGPSGASPSGVSSMAVTWKVPLVLASTGTRKGGLASVTVMTWSPSGKCSFGLVRRTLTLSGCGQVVRTVIGIVVRRLVMVNWRRSIGTMLPVTAPRRVSTVPR